MEHRKGQKVAPKRHCRGNAPMNVNDLGNRWTAPRHPDSHSRLATSSTASKVRIWDMKNYDRIT